jgi:hypothetical protein
MVIRQVIKNELYVGLGYGLDVRGIAVRTPAE